MAERTSLSQPRRSREVAGPITGQWEQAETPGVLIQAKPGVANRKRSPYWRVLLFRLVRGAEAPPATSCWTSIGEQHPVPHARFTSRAAQRAQYKAGNKMGHARCGLGGI